MSDNDEKTCGDCRWYDANIGCHVRPPEVVFKGQWGADATVRPKPGEGDPACKQWKGRSRSRSAE